MDFQRSEGVLRLKDLSMSKITLTHLLLRITKDKVVEGS